MSNATVIVVAVVCLLVGGAAGWFIASSEAPSSPDVLTTEPDERAPEPSDVTLQADADFVGERIAHLEKALDAAVSERDELRKALEEATTDAQAGTDEAARIERALKLDGPRFVYEGMGEALQDMKWKTLAESVVKMGPLMTELGETLAAGQPAGDLPLKIQKYNMPLIQAAVGANQGGMPGHGINGSFTHPALVANMIFSTLVEAGEPLDDTQVEKLNQLADRYVAEDAGLRGAPEAGSFAMERLVLESEMKDRFYKAVDEILRPAQIDVLHPPTLRDRTAGDIFSAGLIWMQSAQVAQVSTREELTERVTAGLMQRFQVPEQERSAVAQVIGDWAAKVRDDAFTPLDTLEKNNMVKMDRIRMAGRPMVELYKEIARVLSAQEEVVTRIRESAFLVVPAARE